MRRVVVLRPEPGASDTVRKARQRGLDAVPLSLFEVEPVAWDVPDISRFDALLLTSAQAVLHGGAGLDALKSLPVYAVGAATADAARDAGFDIATTGDGGVDELLGKTRPGVRLLHVCGEHRRAPATPLRAITPITVYRSRERPSRDLSQAKGAVVLVHSPRAAALLRNMVAAANLNRASVAIAAISPSAAEAAGSGWKSIDVAERPSDDALLALAERLCNKPAT
jgi:uroporphyrinogen-III synthase